MRAAAYPVHQAELGHVRHTAHELDPVAPGRIAGSVPFEEKPGAGNAAKGFFKDFPVVVHDRFRPVQGAVEIPHADVQVLRHLLTVAHGHGAFSVVILLPGYIGRRLPDQAHRGRRIGYQHVEPQGTDHLSDLVEVILPRESHQVRPVAGRFRHQPDADFGNDAEIRLGKHTLDPWPATVLVQA